MTEGRRTTRSFRDELHHSAIPKTPSPNRLDQDHSPMHAGGLDGEAIAPLGTPAQEGRWMEKIACEDENSSDCAE